MEAKVFERLKKLDLKLIFLKIQQIQRQLLHTNNIQSEGEKMPHLFIFSIFFLFKYTDSFILV